MARVAAVTVCGTSAPTFNYIITPHAVSLPPFLFSLSLSVSHCLSLHLFHLKVMHTLKMRGNEAVPESPDSPRSSSRVGFLSSHLGMTICPKPQGLCKVPLTSADMADEVGANPCSCLGAVQDKGRVGRCCIDLYPWKFEYFSISSQLWEEQSPESLFHRRAVSLGVLLDVGNLWRGEF